MAAGNGEKDAMAAEKGASVGENGKGEERAVASERAAAAEKGKAVEEEKEEVAGVTMITVKSMDGEERRLSVAAAERSGTLRGMIEDGCVDQVIPLREITTRTLDTVIEYCTKHATEADPEPVDDSDPSAAAGSSSGGGGGGTAVAEDLKEWDRKLVEGLGADDLYDLLVAANFLEIEGLLDVVFQKAADMIKGKTTREIRVMYLDS